VNLRSPWTETRGNPLYKLALLVLAAAPAWAAPSLAFTLDTDHCTNGCGSGSYGTIVVSDLGGGSVNVLVTLTAGQFVDTGFPGSFGFNVGGIPTLAPTFHTAGWKLLTNTSGSLHFDGFGLFGYTAICDYTGGACGNGGGHPANGLILSFDLTASGGLTPSMLDVLSTLPPGSERAFFVADIIGTNGNTGPVGAVGNPPDGGLPAVPEPSSVILLSTTFVAVLLLMRRKR